MTFGRPTRLGTFYTFLFIFFFKAKCRRVIWTAQKKEFFVVHLFAFTRVYHIFLSSGFKKPKMKNFWTILGPQRIFFLVSRVLMMKSRRKKERTRCETDGYTRRWRRILSRQRDSLFFPFFFSFLWRFGVDTRRGEFLRSWSIPPLFCFLLISGWFTTLKIIKIKKILWWCLWNDVDKDGRVNDN